MNKILHPFILSLLLSFAFLTTIPVVGRPGNPVAPVVDEEYDRYKKRGDDYFKEGKYIEARRQYQNCLEVPGFENDAYATKRIAESTTGAELRQKVDEAVRQGNDQPVVDLLHQLMNLNPEDVLTRKQFADHYERRANQLFNQKQYLDARDNYTAAIEFADANKKETLLIQVRRITDMMAPKKRIGLKVAAGVVAVGAGAMAFLLRNDYQSKVDALNQLGQSFDPNNTGVIANRDAYRQYDDAYKAAEAAKQKNGVFKACLGVAAVATLAEAYLLLHKPKPKPRPTAWNWQPASQSLGLAVRYTF